MTDIVLQEGQKLTEHWQVEFTGMSRIMRPVEKWIECRMVKMYHSTIYAGSVGKGRTVEEARLNMVLAVARAICQDMTAFGHDADEIFKGEQYRWWLSKIQEYQDELEAEEEDAPRKSHITKLKRRIKLLEQMMAEWQEEHDYWPEEDAEAATEENPRLARLKADIARRRAASASLSATAAAVEAGRAVTS
jgi:hypothetical protein